MTESISNTSSLISLASIETAYKRIKKVSLPTPLQHNRWLSDRFGANIYFKREDLQVVRSYKIRGAYNNIASQPSEDIKNGVVCASAGNHAQGFAMACKLLEVQGKVFMPITTPGQKVDKVKLFGGDYVQIELIGDTFDEAQAEALKETEELNKKFIHPFNDRATIAGQGTVGKEIYEQFEGDQIDYILVPIGGGGISAGIGSYIKQVSPETKIIGFEPAGAPAMQQSIAQNQIIRLENIDPFVDGAAVQQIGDITFDICKEILDDIHLVPEGKICTYILDMYNQEAIVVEPAGALSLAGLDMIHEEIKGKNVVCLISGGNNDIVRTEEIKERSMLFEGLKHYFIITFPQRAGALREFLSEVLGPEDDISYFQYTKKTSRSAGPAVVGLECPSRKAYEELLQRMADREIHFEHLNENRFLFDLLV